MNDTPTFPAASQAPLTSSDPAQQIGAAAKPAPPRDYYEGFVNSLLFRNNGDLSKDVSHCVLGMIEEAAELSKATDVINSTEELGDLLFFSVGGFLRLREFAVQRGIDVSKVVSPSALIGADMLEVATHTLVAITSVAESFPPSTGKLSDVSPMLSLIHVVKKWVGYGSQPKDEQIISLLNCFLPTMFSAAVTVAASAETSVSEMIDAAALMNVEKLSTRYAAGFSVESAENRDLEAERRAMEASFTQGPGL